MLNVELVKHSTYGGGVGVGSGRIILLIYILTYLLNRRSGRVNVSLGRVQEK